MVVTVVLILILFVYFLKFFVLKPDHFPPGPPWRPIVGSLQHFKKSLKNTGHQHAAFSQLSNEWKTKVLGLKLGSELVVVVEDFPTIEHILNNKEFDQRPITFFTKLRNMGTTKGITCSEGIEWMEQKQFLTRYLNIISNKRLDFRINEEIHNMMKTVDSSETIDITSLLPYTMINILWSIVAGKRINYRTFKENQLLDIMAKRNKAIDISGGLLAQYSWLRFIIPKRSGYSLIRSLNKELKEFLMQTIKEHQQTWTEDNDSDFIYNYISRMQTEKEKKLGFSEEQLFFVCLDLFIGGFSTTTFTLSFVFLMIILRQDVQRKIHALLDKTFNKNYTLQYQDRYKVPYIEAVIKEVQRYRNVAPIFGPRRTIKKTALAGYSIPKSTTILMNMNPTWMSTEIWGDPEVFRPERFLSEDGNFNSKKQFVPFGLGRRKCPGDLVAQKSLFLITCEILRQYRLLPVDKNVLPSSLPLPGLMMFPVPYKCKFEKRS